MGYALGRIGVVGVVGVVGLEVMCQPRWGEAS